MVRKKKAPRKRATKLERELDQSLELTQSLEEYFMVRRERLALAKQVQELEAMESERKQKVVHQMGKLEKVTCRMGTFSKRVAQVVVVDDWTRFYEWIRRTKNFECLEKRPHQRQVQDLLEEHPRLRKAGIPGTHFDQVIKTTATERK